MTIGILDITMVQKVRSIIIKKEKEKQNQSEESLNNLNNETKFLVTKLKQLKEV